MPDMDIGLSLIEKFGASRVDHTDLLNSHVWGCLTYVLDPMLQDSKKLPKWSPRKWRGQLLDNWFMTIAQIDTEDDFVVPENLGKLFKTSLLNSLSNWDPRFYGPMPDHGTGWLTDAEVQDAD
eukprot:9345090-Ditylum_brightwellii.AAC.2